MGGKDTCCYKDRSLRSKVFSGVWKDFKDYLAVNSYRNTPKKDFGKAKEYLKDWKAQGKLLREIEERNSQIALRSEEHTSELQSRQYHVCRLQLEIKYASHLYL